MSIKEKAIKIKGLVGTEAFFTLGLLFVVAILSFYAGRMSASSSSEKMAHIPMTMTEHMTKSNDSYSGASTTVGGSDIKTQEVLPIAKTGMYVGSRKGTKYHLPTCAGAKTMSEENKIWFSSKEDAASKGYTPAANCKGI